MSKRLLALLFFATIYLPAFAQIFPQENGAFNYRHIGFAPFPSKAPANYNIQIASGDQQTADSFKSHIIKTVACKTNRSIIEVPSFGSKYTWRTATSNGKTTTYGELHHFTTVYSSYSDTAKTHLRVTVPAQKNKEALAFVDGCAILYDMNGKPVWHLPEQFDGPPGYIRDLKTTPFGTITFLAGEKGYEIDYNGNVLWKAPDDGSVSGTMKEFYHHELTRLSNGNYMILGNEPYDVPMYNPDNTVKYDSLGKPRKHSFLFGTVIEYDKLGKVVWSWKSSKYYRESDLVNYYKSSTPSGISDVHENAFYFDEKTKEIFLSFKGISRILKIKYPEGNVLSTYGEIYKPGMTSVNGNGLFCGQHACKYSQVGCLFLFNNNGCTKKGLPKVKKFKEQGDDHTLKKVWEYECAVEDNIPVEFPTGGNVVELPDHTLFVCMGSDYSKVFIVNMDKKVLWSAVPERWDVTKNKWVAMQGYRASMIFEHKTLERLVWGSK